MKTKKTGNLVKKMAIRLNQTKRKTEEIKKPKDTNGFPKREIRKLAKVKKHLKMLAEKCKKAPEKAIVFILVLLTLIFSYGSKAFSFIPTWNAVYKAFGIAPNSYGSLDFEPMPLTLTVLDVGQGECVFVYDEKGTSILYDTGEAGNDEKILSYLKCFDVNELDYLILSHPHSDHIGSARALLLSNQIKIRNVIIPEIDSESLADSVSSSESGFGTLIDFFETAGAGVKEAKAGDSFSKGDIAFTVLAPTSQSENLNNMSLVVRITYGETAFLLMGDAQSEEEYDLLCTCTPATLSADVLVVGHHGSETSSTYDFVSSVKPSYAIISCGADNEYGHPHTVTLNTFESLKTEIYRTDLLGDVVIGTDGKKTIALR